MLPEPWVEAHGVSRRCFLDLKHGPKSHARILSSSPRVKRAQMNEGQFVVE